MRTVRIKLFITTVVLICIGIVMIYSASSIYAAERYKDGAFFLKRHLVFLVIGAALSMLVMKLDYMVLGRFAKPLLLFSFFLLALVLVPGIGREVAGAQRWFRFKFFSFQPSELANLAMIIYIADFVTRKTEYIRDSLRGFLPVLFVLAFLVVLILLQPDLGTALAISAVTFLMLYVSGVRTRYLAGIILTCLPVLFVLIFSVPYRRMRILAFLNPWADPRKSGFQIIQSQLALGSGGLLGVGLGHSLQKLFYLPAAHTDFIFSIIGEELGLVGTLLVILLFIFFIRQGIKIVQSAQNKFGYLLALGLLSMILLKAAVNIGVSSGILPTKGLPLPFISYGGSSLLFDMVSVGLLLNIGRSGESP
ncbi:MAG: putative lipid II flippase FtsW [Candidatus Omnitrophota bacterium]|jgi:cell division protein FtsW|nr:MAG: putative lipid II flippase FtsW [Candidatus Omnitrophota bacterium]